MNDLDKNLRLICWNCRKNNKMDLLWHKNHIERSCGFSSNMPTTVRACSECGEITIMGYKNSQRDQEMFKDEIDQAISEYQQKKFEDSENYMKSRISEIANDCDIVDETKEMLESKGVDSSFVKKDPWIKMKAKFRGCCQECKKPIEVGSDIVWQKGHPARHAVCHAINNNMIPLDTFVAEASA